MSSDVITKNDLTSILNAVLPTAGGGGGSGGGVLGVKGNAESSYRTGNVNLAPSDIGAVPNSRTVNGKALSDNITLSASDVNALASESDPIYSASASAGITSTDITNWNAKSDFSGSYNDLTNKPTLGTASEKDYTISITDSTDLPTATAVKDYVEDYGIFYGTCSTAKGTVAKKATVTGVTELATGLTIAVKFTNENTSSNPTLKVNSLDAKAIVKYGSTVPGTTAAGSWQAGSVVTMTYDGTRWVMHDWNNATYSAMTDAEMKTGTSTTARSITAAILKSAVGYHAPVTSVNGNTGAVTVTVPTNVSDLTNDSNFSSVSINRKIATGTNIADITIDGTTTELYAPTGGSSGIADVQVNGASVVSGGIASVTVPTNVSDLNNDSGYLTTAVTSFNGSTGAVTYTAPVTSVNGSTGAVTISIPTITDTYSGTSSDGMSGKAVKSAIDALDGTITGSPSASKTLTAFSQTDGNVSATFADISITKSQISDFPTDYIISESQSAETTIGTGYWRWREWKSGKVEIWYGGTVTLNTTATNAGGLYRYVRRITFPNNYSLYKCMCIVDGTSAGGWLNCGGLFNASDVHQEPYTKFEAMAYRISSRPDQEQTNVNVYICGEKTAN